MLADIKLLHILPVMLLELYSMLLQVEFHNLCILKNIIKMIQYHHEKYIITIFVYLFMDVINVSTLRCTGVFINTSTINRVGFLLGRFADIAFQEGGGQLLSPPFFRLVRFCLFFKRAC